MTSGPTSVAQNILEPVLPVWPRQSICQVCSWLCWQVLVWAMNWWESRHKGWKRRKNKGWDLNKPRHPSLHQDSQTVKPLAFLFFSFFFFFDLFIYFTLQYCIGFAIHQHDPPQMYMCSPSWNPLPPPSPYHPSGSSQCTSPKHPVSCIEPGLVIHFIYDIIHVSMPFSQFIPPSPSPTESKSLSWYLLIYTFLKFS